MAGGWWLVAGGVSSAWAAVPGSAVLALNDTTDPVSNVGLTVDGGDRYLVVETATISTEQTALDFVKAPFAGGVTIVPITALSDVGGVYPSIIATPTYLYASKKLPLAVPSPALGQMDIVRLTRASMSGLLFTGGVTTSGVAVGRSHLDTLNAAGGQQWICFTDRSPTVGYDDQLMRTTSGGTWSAGATSAVGTGHGEQDHCQMATDNSSAQWIAYHHEVTAGEPAVPAGSTPGIRVKTGTTAFNTGGTLVSSAFLTGSGSYNFPTIATIPTIAVREVVAEAGGLLSLWSCAGSPATCSATGAADVLTGWPAPVTTPAKGVAGNMGYEAKDPKLVLVPRAEGTYDRFLLVQRTKATATLTVPKQVHLWKWCAGEAKWTDVGEMPTPPDNAAIPDYWNTASELGLFKSSGMGLFMTDGTNLHATYVACHQNALCAAGSALHDAVVWSAPANHADLCP